MKTPKISVIIPIYNAAEFLEEALDSVISQTLSDIEIICVNDGSTDASSAILNEYQKNDPRITVYYQPNQNCGAARNLGLPKAQGDYIHFLDADDKIERTAYKQWYEIAQGLDADVAVCFHTQFDYETGHLRARKGATPHNERVIKTSFLEYPQYFLNNISCVAWNKLYKRDFLQNQGITFDSLASTEDRSFYFRVLLRAKEIVVISEYWLHHRINIPNSLVSPKIQAKYFDCHFQSFQTTWKALSAYDDAIKKLILNSEINDMLYFYSKCENGESKDDIRKKLYEFIFNMGNLIFKEDSAEQNWYQKFLMLAP